MIQPLRPSGLANAAQHRLSGYWHGYLGPGKVTALVGVRGGQWGKQALRGAEVGWAKMLEQLRAVVAGLAADRN